MDFLKNIFLKFMSDRITNICRSDLSIENVTILMQYLHFNKKHKYILCSKEKHEGYDSIIEQTIKNYCVA